MYCDLKRYDYIRYLTIRSVNWTLSKNTIIGRLYCSLYFLNDD